MLIRVCLSLTKFVAFSFTVNEEENDETTVEWSTYQKCLKKESSKNWIEFRKCLMDVIQSGKYIMGRIF